MHIYNDMKNSHVTLKTIEKNQKQFKLNLNETTRGNAKKKLENQIKTIRNVKNIYHSKERAIHLFNSKTARGSIWPPCGFSKNVSLKRR